MPTHPRKPIHPPSKSAKQTCKHEWLYNLSKGWYCRCCPATAAFIHKGLTGVIILDESTRERMNLIQVGRI